MNKILKRFLLILIVLIGVILALPKSEKAGSLYEENFDDKVHPNAYYFSNTGNEKWYCLEKNVQSYSYGEKEVVFCFEYDTDKHQYEITYDMGGKEYTVNSSSPEHKILQKIAYLAMLDEGSGAIYKGNGQYSSDATPYNKVAQLALWYTLQQLGRNGNGLGQYFGSENNRDSEEHQLRTRDQSQGHAGEVAYNIVCTGSSVVGEVDSNSAYQLYRKIRDYFKNNNKFSDSDVKYKKILMAIYTSGSYQNLICVNFEPDEPEPEEPKPSNFYGSINGMAWVDGQMRR